MSVAAADAAPAGNGRIDSPGRLAFRVLLSRPTAVFGGVVLIGVIGLALFAPWIAPYDPLATSWSLVRKAPSAAHWFGTDEVGRDLLSRIIWGARASLSAGVIAVAIAVGVGVPTGMVAGYVGGWTDSLISRLTDAMLAIPFLILAIALAAFLGPSLGNAMIAAATARVACTITGGRILGRMCRSRMRIGGLPTARAAST